MELGEQETRRGDYAKSLGLKDAKEFSFYGLLHPLRSVMFSNSDQEQVAFTKEIIQVIEDKRVIDWTEKEDTKREMRKDIRRKLKKQGCPEDRIEPLIRELISLASIQMKNC